MNIEVMAFLSAFMIGLASSGHCLGMCGGIASALGTTVQKKERNLRWHFAYQIGRLFSYMLIGMLAGYLGFGITFLFGSNGGILLRLLTGLLWICIGLYFLNIWRGIAWLETAGRHVWRHISPYTKRLMPVNSTLKAISLGLLWGFLPCGQVYTMLTLALTESHWQTGCLVMLCFGLGTLPMMFSISFMSIKTFQFIKNRQLQVLLGIMMIALGTWTFSFHIFRMIRPLACHHS